MTRMLLLAMPGNEAMASRIAMHIPADIGGLETRIFPDEETYLRITSDLHGRSVAIVATLDRPDAKFVPLIFAADTARDLGASKIGLIAPYLAYMRQDRCFHPGEAITSRSLAKLLSAKFDWLVTVDPHLHRYKSLDDIYSIPSRVLHAAPLIANWIAANVENPVLIGPDAESAQWVGDVAGRVGAPFTVLEKTRLGDRDVEVRIRDGRVISSHAPVLIDDIVSSGQTMLKAVRLLRQTTAIAPVCIAVHGIFAEGADAMLQAEGARLVTSSSVPHPTNQIDVSALLADGIVALA